MPLAGLCQTNQRAEVAAVIFARENAYKNQEVCSDSQYTLDGVEHVLAGELSAIRDNEDLWARFAAVERAAATNAVWRKVTGHATLEDVRAGRVEVADKLGNDEADTSAVGGSEQHSLDEQQIKGELDVRDRLTWLQRMLIAIAMVRARRERAMEGGGGHVGGPPRRPPAVVRGAFPWHNGVGHVCEAAVMPQLPWPGPFKFHWGSGAWAALAAYFREVRWLDPAAPGGDAGTSWLELAMDFEIFSGLSLRLLTQSDKKCHRQFGGTGQVWSIGQKAGAFQAMAFKMSKVLDEWPFPGGLASVEGHHGHCEAMFRLGGALCVGLARRVCFAMPQEMMDFLKCLSAEFMAEQRCNMKREHRIACWYYGTLVKGKQYVPTIPEGVRYLPDRWGVERRPGRGEPEAAV